ncbi:MAG: hypothetical protein IH940_07745 [Acidobacteria bacterium]|nr:hypothetical protein [Acidobacteriota bacterium]
MIAVFLLPVQLEIGALEGVLDSRLAPSDLFLAMAIVLAPRSIRTGRRAVDLLPIGLIAILAYGILVALGVEHAVTDHAVVVKFLGAVMLALLGVVTAAYARAGFARRIVRVFLLGIAISGVLAWIDFKLFNFMTIADSKVDSRFAGMLIDPNNAAALFALGSILSWHAGREVFKHRVTHWVVVTFCAVFLGLTYGRGAMLALVLAAVAIAILGRMTTQRFMRLAAIGLLALPVLFMSGIVDGAVEDFNRRPDNVAARGSIATDGVDAFVESAGWGIGLGTYKETYDEVIHNTALWLLVEMSIVGLLFFLAMSLVPVSAATAATAVDRHLAYGLLGGHLTMVIASAGIEAMYQRHWWLVIGLMSLAYMAPSTLAAKKAIEQRPRESSF